MDWTKVDHEDEKAVRLLGFETGQAASLSGILHLRCAEAGDDGAFAVRIRMTPSQARDLAQQLLKLALDSEATLFDTP